MKGADYKIKHNIRAKDLSLGEIASVIIEVYYKGKRKQFNTGVKVASSQWKGKVTKHPEEYELNNKIDDMLYALKKFEREKSDKFTLQLLEDFVNKGGDQYTFIQYMKDCILRSPDLQFQTKKHHLSIVSLLEQFGLIRHFEDLTYQNIKEFDWWLKKTNIGSENKPHYRTDTTIFTIHKRVRQYIRQAILDERLTDNPYNKFKPEQKKTPERKFLSEHELLIIENKEGLHPRIELVRDVFIFQCYTGLSYSDLFNLNDKDIKVENHQKWLRINRQKTDEKSVVMLLPKAEQILKKYKNKLPVHTNQKYNAFLKELAVICNLGNLTTHMARHTFATTVMLMNGISMEVTQRALGHSSIKTTQIYGKIVEGRIKSEMSKLAETMKPKESDDFVI